MMTSRRLAAASMVIFLPLLGGCGNEETPAGPAASPSPPAAAPAPSAIPSLPPTGNQPPVAVFHTRPEADRRGLIRGRSPLKITFNMCASSDPDGDELVFTHDFDGDGVVDLRGSTGSQCRFTFTYVFTETVRTQVFRPTECVVDRDRATGVNLHDKQCASFLVEVQRR